MKEAPQYTLDEYKKSQGEKKAHQFDTRKANEGAESKWGNARKLEKLKLEDTAGKVEGDKVEEVCCNVLVITQKILNKTAHLLFYSKTF